MAPDALDGLSRRERQIMEALYRLGEATVSDIVPLVPGRPSYDTVRLTLGTLGQKGRVGHVQEGRRYVYRPTVPRREASRSALANVMQTYFSGDAGDAILAMLDDAGAHLSDAELDRIQRRVDEAREGGDE